MKRNEIIELGGKEYTVELNRDSFIQIDKICNISKSMQILNRGLYEYMDDQELDDNYNPFENATTDEDIEKEVKLKEDTLKKITTRAFFIWLYPNHKLSLSQVSELLKPYIEDEKKAEWLGQKLGEFLNASVEVRQEYNEEQKNLKSLAN